MVSIYDALLGGIGTLIVVGFLATQVSIAVGVLPFAGAAVLVALAMFAYAPTTEGAVTNPAQSGAQEPVGNLAD